MIFFWWYFQLYCIFISNSIINCWYIEKQLTSIYYLCVLWPCYNCLLLAKWFSVCFFVLLFFNSWRVLSRILYCVLTRIGSDSFISSLNSYHFLFDFIVFLYKVGLLAGTMWDRNYKREHSGCFSNLRGWYPISHIKCDHNCRFPFFCFVSLFFLKMDFIFWAVLGL